MSNEALVVLNNEQALTVGGIGLFGSRILKVKPSTYELVQKSTLQEGAIPGKFRNISNPDMSTAHVDELRVVLLTVPVEQREYYIKGEFNKDAKLCFSMNNIEPHIRAKEPQCLQCATCPKGDVQWVTWRKTKNPDDIPPCRKYWHVVFADRATKMIHYLNIKGKGVMPFEADTQNVARTLQMMMVNAQAENKRIDVANATVAEGGVPQPHVPMPSLFDVTFTFYAERSKDGKSFIPRIKNVLAMKPEDRLEFGNLYIEYVNSRAVAAAAYAEQESEEAEANAAVTGRAAPVVQEVAAVTKATGEVVGKDEKITI